MRRYTAPFIADDETLLALLKCLFVVQFELSHDGQHWREAHAILTSSILGTRARVGHAWDFLVQTSRELAVHRGTTNRKDLAARLRRGGWVLRGAVEDEGRLGPGPTPTTGRWWRRAQEYLADLMRETRKDVLDAMFPAGPACANGPEDPFVPLALSDEMSLRQVSASSAELSPPLIRRAFREGLCGADELLGRLIRAREAAVVLGGPGSGKTKLLRHWCYLMASRAQRRAGRRVFPVLVSAGDLARSLNAKGRSRSNPAPLLAHALGTDQAFARGLLKNARWAVVLIDGLDEVASGRIEAFGRDEVEQWVQDIWGPGSRWRPRALIIACRRASYSRPLSEVRNHVVIEPLARGQVEELARGLLAHL